MIEIGKNGLGEDKIKENKISKQILTFEEKILQRRKNEEIKRELKKLSKNINCTTIMLKGLILDYELYGGRNERLFSDIDLLVRNENLFEITMWLERLGYEKKNEKVRHYKYISDYFLKCLYEEQVLRLQINHLTYHKNIDGIDIIIEIHTSFAGLRYNRVNYKEIFERAVEVDFIAKGVYKLELHDMILYQICHYCKHLGNYILYNSEKLGVKQRDIHEIAMLIDKYSHDLNWNIIIERAIQWNMLGNINLCFSIISKLYPNLLEKELIAKVRSNTLKFSDRNSHNAVIDDISFLPAQKIMDLDIEKIVRDGRINPSASTYVVARDYQKSSSIVLLFEKTKTTALCFWDNEKISVRLLVELNELSEEYMFNAIMVTIGCENNRSGCYSFIIETHRDKIIVKNEWGEPIYSKLISITDVSMMENGFCASLDVNWNFLNVSPYEGLLLPFNFKVFLKRKAGECCMKSLVQKKYFNFYNNASIMLV